MWILEGCPSTLLANVTLRLISEQSPSAHEPDLVLHKPSFPVPWIPSDIVGKGKMSPLHLFIAFWTLHIDNKCYDFAGRSPLATFYPLLF